MNHLLANNRYLKISLVITGWILFMIMPYVLILPPGALEHLTEQPGHLLFIIFNLFLIGFYYLNSRILIPRLLLNNKRSYYILVVGLIVALIIFIPQLHHTLASNGQGEPPSIRDMIGFLTSLILFSIVFIISSGTTIISHQVKTDQRNIDLQVEKARAELNILKSQIHPHFLFNTLNNIYTLALYKPELAPPAILKLSSLMRYITQEGHEEHVPLQQELLNLNHYIELQSMRLSDKTSVDVRTSVHNTALQIMPLLLIPFVENAFKYGTSTHEPGDIVILSEFKENHFYFTVTNTIAGIASDSVEGARIGIENTRRRLDLYYFGKYRLSCGEQMGKYIVNLSILLS